MNATAVTPDAVLPGHEVVVRGGCVVELRPGRGQARGRDSVDACGGYVLPGLVDVHAHGALRQTFNDTDPSAWRTILDAHLDAGTTTLVATLATDAVDRLASQITTGQRLLAEPDRPMSLGGIHLEGPYLAASQRGAHPAGGLRSPGDGSWDELLHHASALTMITLAPELDGAADVIRWCSAQGIVVSAGHSTAGPEVLAASRPLGLSHLAHLWSGQSMLQRHGPWRQLGLLEAALSSDDYTAEIIADGCHLPAELVRIAYRCLGRDRLCLVSDASAGTGLAEGETFAMGAVRGVVGDGVALSSDGSSFCGSTSFLFDVLRFAVHQARIDLVDATRMAATTPARILGLDEHVGSLRVGARADLLLVSEDINLVAVMKAGHWVMDTRRPRV